MSYDPDLEVLRVGAGEFGPVLSAVYEYTVGGRNVLKAWFDHRKAEPGGRRSGSALDRIIATEWDPDWTAELLELLSVLSQLVDLEPEQANLVSRIREGQLISAVDVQTSGVRLPVEPEHRRPRFPHFTSAPGDAPTQDTLL